MRGWGGGRGGVGWLRVDGMGGWLGESGGGGGRGGQLIVVVEVVYFFLPQFYCVFCAYMAVSSLGFKYYYFFYLQHMLPCF